MSSEEKISAEPPQEEAVEKFPRGRIQRFFPKSRYGFIKDRNGREVYFNIDQVRFVGGKDHRDLQEGQEVGYDLGWTAHGEHVVKIKIY